MYALMDAETNPIAAVYSVSIIVVIAFLGIQLFTSALCTSSMQVRYVLHWGPLIVCLPLCRCCGGPTRWSCAA